MIGFYAAYHSARWGLQRDARFNDLDSPKRLHPDPIPDDRRTAKHKARRRSNSIEVRYNQGNPDVLPPAVRMLEMVDEVHAIVVNTIMSD